MAQIFRKRANTTSKLIILGVVLVLGLLAGGAIWGSRSSYVTQVGARPAQPVPFSHEHHVKAIGIDCRYCHISVAESSFAGFPATEICMTCHSKIHTDSPKLEPVRKSFREGKPIRWTRVYDLPDYVYFDHSIHVKKGIGCVSCHGRVDQMETVSKERSLQMGWCLECHRSPERFVRPRDQIFDLAWEPKEDQLTLGKRLVREYNIQKLTNCSVCHR
jgi:hypothetical protein